MPDHITYGEAFADVYDEWYANFDDVRCVAKMLLEHRPTSVLELGVGTGRLALPLAELAGPRTRVVGLDESVEMLERLHAKDTQRLVHVVHGDMVDDQPAGDFDLIYISYNTLFNVTDRARQDRCLSNITERLAYDGRFVLDACVIDPTSPTQGTTSEQRGDWTVRVKSDFDRVTGHVGGVTLSTHRDGRRIERPWRINYRSPAELDAVCHEYGLRLEARYASWSKDAFDDHSARHISVYRRIR